MASLAPVEIFKEPRQGSVWTRTVFTPTFDPLDIVETVFRVKTKSARVVPFRLFETQKRMAARIGLRNVIVKPRQVGSSTFWLALYMALAATTPNLHIGIYTHTDTTTATMRQTIKNFIGWLNSHAGFDLQIGADNADELEIKNTNSWFFFGTGGGKGGGRSRTLHCLLASEVAHWPGNDPGQELSAMIESVPDGGIVTVESTPNGAVGPFYNIYSSTENSYVKHFYPWYIEPSRKLPLNGHQLSLTLDEQIMVATYNLTHEQIAWRRWKTANLESEGLYFGQEYPEDDVTCFTAGVRTAFPVQRLAQLLKQADVAQYREDPEDWSGDPWDPGGRLLIWEGPRDGENYIAAGDVGGGHRDGDSSVLIVREIKTGRHVATLEGHWSPERFADLSIRVATRYNMAYLSHEANGLGISTANRAANELRYVNYHMTHRRVRNAQGEEFEWTPGFYVSRDQRTELIRRVVQEVIDNRCLSFDKNLIRQMTAVRIDRKQVSGRWREVLDIPGSVHDDHLMAYAQSSALMQTVVVSGDRAVPKQT